jgi:hypothetical protein
LLTELKEKFRDQEIDIVLFLPLGTLLKMDQSMAHYDDTDANYFLWDADFNDGIYRVESDMIKCQNCSGESNIYKDNQEEKDSTVTTTVTVDGEVITKTTNKTTGKKGLSINKDGIIIKN